MKKIIFLFLLFSFATLLRTYKIDTIPLGLYVDEASVAYNAYSILTTGKDEHGVAHPFAFQAFGEYKMPVFIYMTSLSMAFFGKNEFAIRIPSAFFGSLTVIVFYFFAKEIIFFEKKLEKKYKEAFASISTLLFAISPWHIQFSRAGFEAIVALFFFLLGLLLFVVFQRKKHILLCLFSFFFLVASMYSYNAFRVIGFVSVVCLLAFLFFHFPKEWKKTSILGLVALLFSLPMLIFSFTLAGQARFVQVSAFTPRVHTAFFFYPLQYLSNYLSHFSLPFLFSDGDTIGRHTVFRMGPNFKWEIIFLFAGIYFLLREKFSQFSGWIIFLFAVSPLAASLALPSPHLLRSLPLTIPIAFVVTYAIVHLWKKIAGKKKYIFFGIIFCVACFEFFLYLDLYYNFASVSLADWGVQYKELITKLAAEKQEDTIIVVNDNVGMNPVYVKFYHPEMTILTVDETWTKPATLVGKDILYVTSAGEKPKNIYIHLYPHTRIDTITTPDKYHTPLYTIWKI